MESGRNGHVQRQWLVFVPPEAGIFFSYLSLFGGSLMRRQIFANGLILQDAWLDHKLRRQHRELVLQAHEAQTIIDDTSFKPLARVQALLLCAFHALHGENTSRVVYIVSMAMRFATFHCFHGIRHDGTEETDMKIKAWWCIYS